MADRVSDSSWYRAVWRWHFYAGLLVLPVLVMLAMTGGLYLFQPELNHALYHRFIDVEPRAAPPAAASAATASIESALDGRLLQITLPERPDRSVNAIVRVASGDVRTAYADPYDARFLGSSPYGGVLQTIRKIHSLQLFGFWASSIVEIAAGWAIVLVGSGFVLWWPRGRSGGVATIRGDPSRRTFWRDLHAVTGAFSGAVILFLAATGMPWSMFWGNRVQGWATSRGLTKPAAPAEVTPAFLLGERMPGLSDTPHHEDHAPPMPWALEVAPRPESSASSGSARPIGLDEAVARFEELRVPRPFGVQPPEGPKGAYVATFNDGRAENERTVYLDQYSGEVLADVRYGDYGPVAKAVAWGVDVHMGQQYGPVNRALMLAGCVAILLLTLSAPVMWWKRRPRGSWAVPPPPTERRAATAVLACVAGVGLVFPLVGASLLCALTADAVWRRMSAHGAPARS